MTTDFSPTHLICLDNGRRIEVELIDGAAYTAEEAESGSTADYERQPDGSWTFQGGAFSGSVYPLNDHGVPDLRSGDRTIRAD